MEELSVNLVVIGSGPAGQKAAIQAAKLKKSVVVIEKEGLLGGACLHSGTIPSKSLRAAILDLTEFYQRSFYSKEYHFKEFSLSDLTFRLNKVIESQRKIIERQFLKNKIGVLYGLAEFENSRSILVKDDHGEVLYKINCENVIISSGSKPRTPDDVPFDNKRVLDSTTLLSIDKLPKKIVVLGGGVIGSEYASFFAALGAEVIVIDKKDHMLPRLDREIGVHLQSGLKNIGLKFLGNRQATKIEVFDDKVHIDCNDETHIEADLLLYTLGRLANVEDLKIENVGLDLNKRGYISVNSFFQTNIRHIYAVGDVIGGASLASTSMEEGRLAALSVCGENTHNFPEVFPLGIYTIPEISSCGITEEEAKKRGYNYEVGRAYY